MWTLRIALFVTLAAAIAAWIAQAVIIDRYIGMEISGFCLFIIAHPVSKLGMIFLFALGSLLCVASLMAINEVGPVSFAVTAPQRVEQLFVFSLALWPSAFAFLMLLVARTRRANAIGA